MAGLLLGGACADESGDGRTTVGVNAPRISVNPNPVVFDQTAVGSTNTKVLTIANTGTGTLLIDAFDLVDPSGFFDIEFDGDLSATIEIEEGAAPITMRINYTPLTADLVTAYILVHSNDNLQTDLRIDLTPPSIAARIACTPDPLNFGRVPAGTVETETVRIQNIGQADLIISDLFVTGSADFTLVDENLGDELPITISSFETIDLEVEYSPNSDGYDEGIILVRSNDLLETTKEIELFANGAEPCLSVTHEGGYDFGPTLFGVPREEAFTITNCADVGRGETLVVSDVGFIDTEDITSSDRFTLDLTGLFDAGDLVLEAGESETFTMTYISEAETVDTALLQILSNDTFKNPLHIDIRGNGSANACPTAVINCRVGSSIPSNQVAAAPLQTLQCDGLASSDIDGVITSYLWTITERPDGSTAGLDPNESSASPTIFLDLAGTFRLQLEVFDDGNIRSCNPAEAVIVVIPDEAIHVQLVWNTPAAPSPQADRGVDMDLHFLHPLGRWFQSPWDVYYSNKTPTWNAVSHPSLDIDDTSGAGPENVNLDDPEEDLYYRVGVQYYSDHGISPSTTFTTLRVFLNGVLTFEIPNRELTTINGGGNCSGQFWDVCAIHWPTGQIVRIDLLYDDAGDSIPGSCP